MIDPCPRLATTGEIAKILGRPTHKVEYVVRTRGIRPSARVGNLRVFSQADVDYVAAELKRIEADRGAQT